MEYGTNPYYPTLELISSNVSDLDIDEEDEEDLRENGLSAAITKQYPKGADVSESETSDAKRRKLTPFKKPSVTRASACSSKKQQPPQGKNQIQPLK